MKITKDQEEIIVNAGAFGYSPKKLASILGITESDIQTEMKKKDSQFNKLMQRGKDTADYVIDLKLFELAKSGDIKAIEQLDYRKRTRK